MPRKTTSTASRYKDIREKAALTRESAACELNISDDKLERIENGKQRIDPLDVFNMSNIYKAPELCNYYCHYDCPIGREYVPAIEDNELPAIIVKLLNSLYLTENMDRQLISIVSDGKIDNSEIPTFVEIQQKLEQLSEGIEALQLCIERKIDNGEINKDIYMSAVSTYKKQYK